MTGPGSAGRVVLLDSCLARRPHTRVSDMTTSTVRRRSLSRPHTNLSLSSRRRRLCPGFPPSLPARSERGRICEPTGVLAKFQGVQEDALYRSSPSDVFAQIACSRPPERTARRTFSQPLDRRMSRSLYTGNLLSPPRTGNVGLCMMAGRSYSVEKTFESVVHHAAYFVADRLSILHGGRRNAADA